MSIAYLDTSAIIKLVRIEVNSETLRTWLGEPGRSDQAWVSSALVLTEVPRALRRILPGSPLPDFSRILGRLTLRNVDEEILVQAGSYAEPTLRSLDAIHLATARSIASAAGDEFEALITYDRRLADVAKADGLDVMAPA
ncbi:MAG: type II toxin-antitoxin system VapC family toxin [Deltaproteobacteria bacterium]